LPGNVRLQTALAKQMFAIISRKRVCLSGADVPLGGGRGIAADIWFNEVKSMPVSRASVQALQRFLCSFPPVPPRRMPASCSLSSRRS
jgi:hypothetical protein